MDCSAQDNERLNIFDFQLIFLAKFQNLSVHYLQLVGRSQTASESRSPSQPGFSRGPPEVYRGSSEVPSVIFLI